MLSSCSKEKDNKDNPPVITNVWPLEGPKGTRVTIQGSHFGNNGANTSVFFNDRRASILSINDETIVCNVPEKAGSGTIKVVTANNTEVSGPLFKYKFTAMVTTLAGGLNSGYVDGIGVDAKFGQSHGLCNDEWGNVYMVDYFNSKVRKVTPQGVVTTIAGGTSGYADGTGSAALFAGPMDIVYAGNNNFYIADTYNHMIRKMSVGGVVSTIAGAGSVGFANGNGTAAKFYNPRAICLDANGNIYVAEALNHKIRKISPSGDVTTLAGSSQGYQDGEGTNAKFDQPGGICVDAQGNVYVSEFNNNKIRKITPSGVVSTLAGSSAGSADGVGAAAQFNGPAGICIDKDGNIFVTDSKNNCIRMVTPSGEVTTLTITGDIVNHNFFNPTGISIDANGVLYIMDTYLYRIRKIILD